MNGLILQELSRIFGPELVLVNQWKEYAILEFAVQVVDRPSLYDAFTLLGTKEQRAYD